MSCSRGRAPTKLYARFFKFPQLELSARGLLLAIAFCAGCAIAGAMSPVVSATRLPPADAMRPAAPAHYRRSLAVQVLRGIEAGQRVVLHPSDRVRDGVHVEVD